MKTIQDNSFLFQHPNMKMVSKWSVALSILAATAVPSKAFAPANHGTLTAPISKPIVTSSSLFMGPPADPSPPITEQTASGEEFRQFRRTVYTHNEWVKHRSDDRFWKNLGTTFSSGIYKNVSDESFVVSTVAAAVCLWNGMASGFQDLEGVKHDAIFNSLPVIGLPLSMFNLVSSALGLLLVFRTNTSYGRWDEARKSWGLNINHTRDLNRMATAWYGNVAGLDSATPKMIPFDPAQRENDLRQVSLLTWAFVRSMKRHLSPPDEDEEEYLAEMKSRLSPSQAEAIISAAHRPNRALYDLSIAVEKLPMHFMRKHEINKNLSIFEDTLGGCERLLSSPVPLFYSRHSARFLATWLLLLPFALYDQFGASWNHLTMIPASAFISLCLFGIEELATQLEEPFTILPMQGFCDKIGANCDEIISWAGEGMDDFYEKQSVSAKNAEAAAAVTSDKATTVTEEKDEVEAPRKRRSLRSLIFSR